MGLKGKHFKRCFLRAVGLCTCLLFSATTSAPAQVLGSVFPREAKPSQQTILSDVTLPPELGKIEIQHVAPGGAPFVFFIQDAHAVIEAQNNISGILHFLHERYGIQTVGVEGSDGTLDSTLFQTFPDTHVREKVMQDYLRRGEITGAGLASINGSSDMVYHGIENWSLYEQNYIAYLKASLEREGLLARLKDIRLDFDRIRQNLYSDALNRFHEEREAFFTENSHLLEFSKFLVTLNNSENLFSIDQLQEQYPQMSTFLETMEREDTGPSIDVDTAIRRLALSFGRNYSDRLEREQAMEFNGRMQAFMAGQEEPGSFLRFIVDTGKSIGLNPRLSPMMKELMGRSEKLSHIKGSRLFDELNRLLEAFEDKLITTPQQKNLAFQYRSLRLLKEITELEISREGLEEYQRDAEKYLNVLGGEQYRQALMPALYFYQIALDRDRVFHDKLREIMAEDGSKNAAVITGGFHRTGFERLLRDKGYSYAVITPGIQSLDGHEMYEPVMHGEISYADEVRDNFYDAFARHASSALISEVSEPEFRKNMKIWRDEIIRKLANEGRVSEAGEYTRYVDALTRVYTRKFGENHEGKSLEAIVEAVRNELEDYQSSAFDSIWNPFEKALEGYLAGLRSSWSVPHGGAGVPVSSLGSQMLNLNRSGNGVFFVNLLRNGWRATAESSSLSVSDLRADIPAVSQAQWEAFSASGISSGLDARVKQTAEYSALKSDLSNALRAGVALGTELGPNSDFEKKMDRRIDEVTESLTRQGSPVVRAAVRDALLKALREELDIEASDVTPPGAAVVRSDMRSPNNDSAVLDRFAGAISNEERTQVLAGLDRGAWSVFSSEGGDMTVFENPEYPEIVLKALSVDEATRYFKQDGEDGALEWSEKLELNYSRKLPESLKSRVARTFVVNLADNPEAVPAGFDWNFFTPFGPFLVIQEKMRQSPAVDAGFENIEGLFDLFAAVYEAGYAYDDLPSPQQTGMREGDDTALYLLDLGDLHPAGPGELTWDNIRARFSEVADFYDIPEASLPDPGQAFLNRLDTEFRQMLEDRGVIAKSRSDLRDYNEDPFDYFKTPLPSIAGLNITGGDTIPIDLEKLLQEARSSYDRLKNPSATDSEKKKEIQQQAFIDLIRNLGFFMSLQNSSENPLFTVSNSSKDAASGIKLSNSALLDAFLTRLTEPEFADLEKLIQDKSAPGISQVVSMVETLNKGYGALVLDMRSEEASKYSELLGANESMEALEFAAKRSLEKVRGMIRDIEVAKSADYGESEKDETIEAISKQVEDIRDRTGRKVGLFAALRGELKYFLELGSSPLTKGEGVVSGSAAEPFSIAWRQGIQSEFGRSLLKRRDSTAAALSSILEEVNIVSEEWDDALGYNALELVGSELDQTFLNEVAGVKNWPYLMSEVLESLSSELFPSDRAKLQEMQIGNSVIQARIDRLLDSALDFYEQENGTRTVSTSDMLAFLSNAPGLTVEYANAYATLLETRKGLFDIESRVNALLEDAGGEASKRSDLRSESGSSNPAGDAEWEKLLAQRSALLRLYNEIEADSEPTKRTQLEDEAFELTRSTDQVRAQFLKLPAFIQGDIHASHDNFVANMRAAGVFSAEGKWTGNFGVSTGNEFGRGNDDLKVNELLRRLQVEAMSEGRNFIRLIGNHEWMFLRAMQGHEDSQSAWIFSHSGSKRGDLLSRLIAIEKEDVPPGSTAFRELVLSDPVLAPLYRNMISDVRSGRLRAAVVMDGYLITHAGLTGDVQDTLIREIQNRENINAGVVNSVQIADYLNVLAREELKGALASESHKAFGADGIFENRRVADDPKAGYLAQIYAHSEKPENPIVSYSDGRLVNVDAGLFRGGLGYAEFKGGNLFARAKPVNGEWEESARVLLPDDPTRPDFLSLDQMPGGSPGLPGLTDVDGSEEDFFAGKPDSLAPESIAPVVARPEFDVLREMIRKRDSMQGERRNGKATPIKVGDGFRVGHAVFYLKSIRFEPATRNPTAVFRVVQNSDRKEGLEAAMADAEEFALDLESEKMIGRHPSLKDLGGIILSDTDTSVSRRHLTVRYEDGDVVLDDNLGSRNGYRVYRGSDYLKPGSPVGFERIEGNFDIAQFERIKAGKTRVEITRVMGKYFVSSFMGNELLHVVNFSVPSEGQVVVHLGRKEAAGKAVAGRVVDHDLFGDSDALSRDHALIIFEADSVKVQDLKSRNGTYVNGVKLNPELPPLELQQIRRSDLRDPKSLRQRIAIGFARLNQFAGKIMYFLTGGSFGILPRTYGNGSVFLEISLFPFAFLFRRFLFPKGVFVSAGVFPPRSPADILLARAEILESRERFLARGIAGIRVTTNVPELKRFAERSGFVSQPYLINGKVNPALPFSARLNYWIRLPSVWIGNVTAMRGSAKGIEEMSVLTLDFSEEERLRPLYQQYEKVRRQILAREDRATGRLSDEEKISPPQEGPSEKRSDLRGAGNQTALFAQVDELEMLLEEKQERMIRDYYPEESQREDVRNYLKNHQGRVLDYTTYIGRELVKEGRLTKLEYRVLALAAKFHDIGKSEIPHSILFNEGGRLPPSDFEIMKSHVTLGRDGIARLIDEHPGRFDPALTEALIGAVAGHHENWDGSGYPLGLSGENISLMGRVMRIADTFSAMSEPRGYQHNKKVFTVDAIMQVMVDGMDKSFDSSLVETFLDKLLLDTEFLKELDARRIADSETRSGQVEEYLNEATGDIELPTAKRSDLRADAANELKELRSNLEGAMTEPQILYDGNQLKVVSGATRIIAIGDIHGDIEGLYTLLMHALGKTDAEDYILDDLITSFYQQDRPARDALYEQIIDVLNPSFGDVFAFAGDYVDRGYYSDQVIEFIIALRKRAEKQGARVMTAGGNHDFVFASLFHAAEQASLKGQDISVDGLKAEATKIATYLGFNINSDYKAGSYITETIDSFAKTYGDYEGMVQNGIPDFFKNLQQEVVIDQYVLTHAMPVTPGFFESFVSQQGLDLIEKGYEALVKNQIEDSGRYDNKALSQTWGYVAQWATGSESGDPLVAAGVEKLAQERRDLYGYIEASTEGKVKPRVTMVGHDYSFGGVTRIPDKNSTDVIALDGGLTPRYRYKSDGLGGYAKDADGNAVYRTQPGVLVISALGEMKVYQPWNEGEPVKSLLQGETPDEVLDNDNARRVRLMAEVDALLQDIEAGEAVSDAELDNIRKAGEQLTRSDLRDDEEADFELGPSNAPDFWENQMDLVITHMVRETDDDARAYVSDLIDEISLEYQDALKAGESPEFSEFIRQSNSGKVLIEVLDELRGLAVGVFNEPFREYYNSHLNLFGPMEAGRELPVESSTEFTSSSDTEESGDDVIPVDHIQDMVFASVLKRYSGLELSPDTTFGEIAEAGQTMARKVSQLGEGADVRTSLGRIWYGTPSALHGKGVANALLPMEKWVQERSGLSNLRALLALVQSQGAAEFLDTYKPRRSDLREETDGAKEPVLPVPEGHDFALYAGARPVEIAFNSERFSELLTPVNREAIVNALTSERERVPDSRSTYVALPEPQTIDGRHFMEVYIKGIGHSYKAEPITVHEGRGLDTNRLLVSQDGRIYNGGSTYNPEGWMTLTAALHEHAVTRALYGNPSFESQNLFTSAPLAVGRFTEPTFTGADGSAVPLGFVVLGRDDEMPRDRFQVISGNFDEGFGFLINTMRKIHLAGMTQPYLHAGNVSRSGIKTYLHDLDQAELFDSMTPEFAASKLRDLFYIYSHVANRMSAQPITSTFEESQRKEFFALLIYSLVQAYLPGIPESFRENFVVTRTVSNQGGGLIQAGNYDLGIILTLFDKLRKRLYEEKSGIDYLELNAGEPAQLMTLLRNPPPLNRSDLRDKGYPDRMPELGETSFTGNLDDLMKEMRMDRARFERWNARRNAGREEPYDNETKEKFNLRDIYELLILERKRDEIGTDAYYALLREKVDPRLKVQNDLGSRLGREAYEAVRTELGPELLPLLVEPGVSTRTDQLIDFLKPRVRQARAAGITIDNERLTQFRDAFKEHLGTARTMRSLSLTPEQALTMLEEGIRSQEYDEFLQIDVSEAKMSEYLSVFTDEESFKEELFKLRDEDSALARVYSRGSHYWTQGLRGDMLTRTSHLGGGGSMLNSVTEYTSVAEDVVKRDVIDGTAKPVLYLFDIELPEIEVLRYNDSYFPYVIPEDYIQREKSSIRTSDGAVYQMHDPKVESFVEFKIDSAYVKDMREIEFDGKTFESLGVVAEAQEAPVTENPSEGETDRRSDLRTDGGVLPAAPTEVSAFMPGIEAEVGELLRQRLGFEAVENRLTDLSGQTREKVQILLASVISSVNDEVESVTDVTELNDLVFIGFEDRLQSFFEGSSTDLSSEALNQIQKQVVPELSERIQSIVMAGMMGESVSPRRAVSGAEHIDEGVRAFLRVASPAVLNAAYAEYRTNNPQLSLPEQALINERPRGDEAWTVPASLQSFLGNIEAQNAFKDFFKTKTVSMRYVVGSPQEKLAIQLSRLLKNATVVGQRVGVTTVALDELGARFRFADRQRVLLDEGEKLGTPEDYDPAKTKTLYASRDLLLAQELDMKEYLALSEIAFSWLVLQNAGSGNLSDIMNFVRQLSRTEAAQAAVRASA